MASRSPEYAGLCRNEIGQVVVVACPFAAQETVFAPRACAAEGIGDFDVMRLQNVDAELSGADGRGVDAGALIVQMSKEGGAIETDVTEVTVMP